jgi:hypothetical protein
MLATNSCATDDCQLQLVIVDDEPIVLESAFRHGVEEADILHAYANALVRLPSRERGLVMWIGPSCTGAILEIATNQWHGLTGIVHAMVARKSILREAGMIR